jgi:glutathione-specific gamma-glutamylcyclotransferase
MSDMWLFSYGSLMWDNWELSYGCLRRVVATLPGFRRAFNKASVKNWGTRENPGPTLNLVADSSSNCKGIAFEFPERERGRVLACLEKREGKGFRFEPQKVRLESGDWVDALVPIYSGKNVLSGKTLAELARMARKAHGTKGSSVDYVRNAAGKLELLGIDDAVVKDFLREIELGQDDRRTPDVGIFR